MFEYLDPDASGASNLHDDQGTGFLPLPPRSGANSKGTRYLKKVRHMLYGSLAGIDRTIKILHAHGYTDPNDGRDPIPVPPTSDIVGASPSAGAVWMAIPARITSRIATKTVLIE